MTVTPSERELVGRIIALCVGLLACIVAIQYGLPLGVLVLVLSLVCK